MAAPTQERMRKPDWEVAGKRRRRSDTLGALRSRVGDDVIAEAHRWIADWELAVNGYCDAMKDGGEPAIPGNVFTFNALRGKAWRPIKDFWQHAGQEKHKLLVQMLAFGWSFASIGRANWPGLKDRMQRQKASDACEEVLLCLAAFWQELRRTEAGKAIHAARAYRATPSLPALCREYGLAAPRIRRLIARGEEILNRTRHNLVARAD